MNTSIRLIPAALLLVSACFTAVSAAPNGSGGGSSNPYADCMNGCWRSHKYCKAHQSGQMDCNHQLGQCIEYCESEYDPQIGTGASLPIAPPPGKVAQ